MKTLHKILFITVTATFLAAQAKAVLYWGRPYDPNLQRWIQRDPIGEQGGINLYDYVVNNPINEVDPFGLWSIVQQNSDGSTTVETQYGRRVFPPGAWPPPQPAESEWNNDTLSWEVHGGITDLSEYYANATLQLLTAPETGTAKAGLGVIGGLKCVAKAVNSNLSHAAAQAAERGVFNTASEAADALRNLSQSITKNGFPAGTLADTAYADRVLVPIGKNGMAVYQIGANGTAKLKTVLIAH